MEDETSETFSDWDEIEDSGPVKSLFCDREFASIPDLIEYDRSNFSFDLQRAAEFVGSDEVALITLVNFIRSNVAGAEDINRSFIDDLQLQIQQKSFIFQEKYMIPIIQDDPLLFMLRNVVFKELDDEIEEDEADLRPFTGLDASDSSTLSQLRDKELTIEKYRTLVASLVENDASKPDDAYYFGGYSHLSIHETMLRDSSRTSAYAEALEANASILEGKVVLDIGCGTGILCLLAARAGARKVIGIDLSSIVEKTRAVVKRNGYSDKITILKGRVEEVSLPLDLCEVDIIVSEWMGYGLFYENMLPSVLYARDKYLKEGGLMMPSSSSLYIAASTALGEEDRVSWWKNVYGFSMEDMVDLLTEEAQVQVVDPEAIISDRCRAHFLDIASADDSDLDFDAPFTMVISASAELKAFVLSFDVLFAGKGFTKEVILSTGVNAETTHWKQVALWLEVQNCSHVSPGTTVVGNIAYSRSPENPRDYSITVSWMLTVGPRADEKFSQTFILAS